MPVIANTHPKGGVGKTTSSVNIVGEMKSDTVDLDTHTGLSIILGLRPEGKEISVKVPKTVDELIEIMTPYKNSDKTLLIDCGGFDSDLTRTAIAFADCVIVPSKDSLTERIGLMHFDGVLDEISSIMGTDITAHLYPSASKLFLHMRPLRGASMRSMRYIESVFSMPLRERCRSTYHRLTEHGGVPDRRTAWDLM